MNSVRLHARLCPSASSTVPVEFGPSADLRRRALEVCEEAYRADMTVDAVMDYGRHVRTLLENSAIEEDERAELRLTAFSLEAIPIERNAYLKRQYVTAFELSRLVYEGERPFVTKILNEPEGTWALEEYEKLLLAQEFPRRARRVRRYRESLRGLGERAVGFVKGLIGGA